MNKVFGPKNLKAILRETYEIYRKNFSRLLTIVAIVLGPIFLLEIISIQIESSSLFIAVSLIVLCCIIVAYPLMMGALIHAVSEQYLRQTIGIGRAYRFARGRLGALIGSTIIAVLAAVGIWLISVGLVLSIVFLIGKIGTFLPSNGGGVMGFFPLITFCVVIYFIVRWLFISEAASLEGLSSKAALSRSSALVKGNWWRILGIMFVLSILISPIIIILGIIPLIGKIIGAILTTPFIVVGRILLYYDLRLRKEGYNVETLSGELNIESDLRFTKVWDDLSNEAFTLFQQGQFPEAAKRLQEALKAAEDTLGPEHLDVATILRNLAGLSEAQGKYADAETFYIRLLKIEEKALGQDHPDVAVTCENMAELYRQIGKEDEANKLETRAKKIRSKR
jgi:hypothetical protein